MDYCYEYLPETQRTLAHLREQLRWRDPAVELPTLEETLAPAPVLVRLDDGSHSLAHYDGGHWWERVVEDEDETWEPCAVVAWMPIPQGVE